MNSTDIAMPPVLGELSEHTLLRQAIGACLRASNHAEAEDRIWLTMAAALLRCDLTESVQSDGQARTVDA